MVEGRALPTYAQETRRLRELHETYAWQVNAAIGEGREDIVRQLCDDFLSEALEIMAAGVLLSGLRDSYAAYQLPHGRWPW